MALKPLIDDEKVPSAFFLPPQVFQNIPVRAHVFYFRALRILQTYPDVIPRSIIVQLENAAEMGHEQALDRLVTLIRRNTLPNIPSDTKLRILSKFAPRHKDAAYECALAYIGMGNFKQPTNHALSKKNFVHAIELGHEMAFAHFLSALCDGYLKIRRKDFIDTCDHLVIQHRNTQVALTFGALYCGLEIINRPELTTLFMLNDPNKGFNLLKFVFEFGKQGKNEESERALTYIIHGIQRKIFSCNAALEFQKIHNISPSTIRPSRLHI